MNESCRDVKLLSFGGEEEAEEEPVVFKKKPIVRPDREQQVMHARGTICLYTLS